MDEKIKRIKNWMENKPDYPVTIEINPTNNCNSKCISCWLREFKPELKEELSKEHLLRIVKEAAEIGVKEIRIPGSGEPLMKEGFIEVIKEIKKQQMFGLLITNGTLLNEETIRELIRIEWDCLTISIDGPNAKINDFLRGLPGYFKKVISNLKILKEIKDKEKKEKPILRFNVVLSNKNYDQILGIFEIAKNYGCKDVQVQTLTIWGKKGKKLKLNKKETELFQKKISKIKEFAEKNEIFTNIEEFKNKELIEKTNKMDEVIFNKQKRHNQGFDLPCFEPWYNMIILPNGTVTPCSIAGGEDWDNVKRKKLKEIWFGKKFQELRQNLLNNRLPHYCKTCCVAVHLENKRIKEELQKCEKK